MQILVVGCGRVGAAVVEELVDAGQDVIVIDSQESQLTRIEHVNCEKIVGIPIDKKVLADAGIEYCDAFLGLSDLENINAMTAGIAKNHFNVPQCVIRVFNPMNVPLYHSQGFGTISQTELVMERVLETLNFEPALDETNILGQELIFRMIDPEPRFIGLTVQDLYTKYEVRVIGLLDGEHFELSDPGMVIMKSHQLMTIDMGE